MRTIKQGDMIERDGRPALEGVIREGGTREPRSESFKGANQVRSWSAAFWVEKASDAKTLGQDQAGQFSRDRKKATAAAGV